MSTVTTPERTRFLLRLVVFSAIVGGLLWLDRGSTERGNRLYRKGDLQSATEIYRTRASRTAAVPPLSYNFGTALLLADPVESGRQLRRGAARGDSSTAQRSYYNLGYLLLTSLDPSLERKTAIALLASSVGSNRSALKLNPGDQNARWNLGLAQRMLDSLTENLASAPDRTKSQEEKQQQQPKTRAQVNAEALGSSGEAEGGPDREADNPQPGGGGGQRESIVGGESEARAGQDPGPLTVASALNLVKGIVDPPEQLIQGLLWSHRPNVSWWLNQPFPGGNW